MSTDDDFVSVFDLFSIGIGPSSSHTVGPMRAALEFARSIAHRAPSSVTVELFGSLAATGIGHGTVPAVILGLAGFDPRTVDPGRILAESERITKERRLALAGNAERVIDFSPRGDVVLRLGEQLPLHPNGMRFTAQLAAAVVVEEYYSVGGGFVINSKDWNPAGARASAPPATVPFPFTSGAELLELCTRHGITIDAVVRANEESRRSRESVDAGLDEIWAAMQECVRRGLGEEGLLPGALKVPRRARSLHAALREDEQASGTRDPMEWIGPYALAVNEENAAGGRVVTAPTNGAAGIVPAVLHHFHDVVPGAGPDDTRRFLLTAAAIAILCKRNTSISGTEVGCQGEVGSACAMAAGALTAVLGGSPAQVENAAEIGIEHNLGLTCDPVGGLVQIPCIERNAIASVKAVAAARMSLRGDGDHRVSLDMAIATVRSTGADMSHRYKETSLGGLAVNVVEC